MHFIGLTDRGRRPRNEDCLRWDHALAAAAVADGLGGHPAGDVASRVAIDVLFAALADAQSANAARRASGESLPKAVLRAHQAVRTLAASRPDYRGMGTTLVAVMFEPESLRVVHVGDSRLYRLRAGVLECLTEDHATRENRLTRALGLAEELRPDQAHHRRLPDDRYLLCSDGLSGALDDPTIGRLLGGKAPAQALLEASLRAGASDNISLIIATPTHTDPLKEP